MAISFKTDPDHGYGIAALFGVSPKLITTCKEAGISIVLSGPGKYTIQTSKGVVLGAIPVAGAAVSHAKAGTLGPTSKSALKAQFEAVMLKAVGQADDNLLDSLAKPIQKFVKSTPDPASIPAKGFPPKQSVPGMEQETGAVALKDAKSILQPIKGTSPSSVYYVVAMYPGMNIAARMKSAEISIRAEGALLGDYKGKLSKLKFDDNGSYCSVHFKIGEPELAVKTLGAIAAMLGINKATAMADFNQFVGA